MQRLSGVCSISLFICGLSLLAASSVSAEQLPYEPPFIELGLGATNIETTVGNSGLTAGVSKEGDLTMVSWPSPSYFDHMHYMTTNAPDARQRPRFGATESMGAFAGLTFVREGQTDLETSFFRDADWDIEARFLAEDVGIIETRFVNDDLGITVRQLDMVPYEHDVFLRRFLVERDANSPVESASILAYSNLSPNLSKIPQVPLLDALIDHKNDFLAVWQQTEEAVMHFHPGDTGIASGLAAILQPLERDFGPLGELLEAATPDTTQIDQLAASLDDHYAEGVYIAVSSLPSPVEFQIGEDTTDTCAVIDELADNVQTLRERFPEKSLPAPPEMADSVRCGSFDPVQDPRDENQWQYTAEDAFSDAQDGQLSGNRLAGAQVNAAIKFPLDFEADQADATLVLAFGATAAEANAELDWVRSQDVDTVQQDIVDADRGFIDDLWIPAEITGRMRQFMKRTFLNLRVGTDRQTGAIVASVSRQPSYQLDWPRDGAFFNIALDLAGQHDLVSRRMEFYSDTIRDSNSSPNPLLNGDVPGWPDDPAQNNYPADSWEMNYYADGMTGGNIRLEIDNTALLVWAYVYHVGHLDGQAREDYIAEAWPTIERAAEWLHYWRDPETGLNWWANEDDHAAFTQGLQGSSTTYGALVSAARLAKYIGEGDLADKWLHRAGELKQATIKYMYVEGEGFRGHPDPDEPGAGSPHWLIWPTHMFPHGDERITPQISSGLDKHLADVSGESAGGQYATKVAISAALALPDGDERDEAYEIAERLATEVANPNTFTLGEHYSALDTDDDGQFDDGWVNGVSTPHLWSMTLVYLTAAAYHHPERFDAYDDILPQVDVPEVDPPGGMGGEDAGGDVGADAGAADTGDASEEPDAPDTMMPGVEENGCGCSSGGGPTPGSIALMMACLGLVGVLRRRCWGW
ncbi:MAG: MYXO-CTERM sorting domain-containing protein [Persicimonas sp.]